MPFSLPFLERVRRRATLLNAMKEVVTGLLEPFRLKAVYPIKEVELPQGGWKDVQEIMPHQMKIHRGLSMCGRPSKFILFNGGVGSGKTVCLCAEMVRLLRTYPGIKIVVITGYDYYFHEFLLPTFQNVMPFDSRHVRSWNAKSMTLRLVNGSMCRFKAYDDPDKVKGWEAHVIWVEEASELGDGNSDKAFQIYQALLMRLRCRKPNYPLRLYASQNPKGHNWTWKVWIKGNPAGDSGNLTVLNMPDGRECRYKEYEKIAPNGDVFYTVSTGTGANTNLPPGYLETMLEGMADSPEVRRRMVEGDFNPINTLVYDWPIYGEKTHVVPLQAVLDYWEVTELPTWWPVIVGIDCGGERSPWAIEWYIQTEEGHWLCFDEFYQAGMVWDEVADIILERSKPFESVQYYIDPISSNMKQGPTSVTIKEEFLRRGIFCEQPPGYNKHGGAMHVQSFLKRDHTEPCPYLPDTLVARENDASRWEIGKANLYYITDCRVPTDRNPFGHACPGNIKEKTVFRYDSKRTRAPKEHEEGLSPLVSEKFVDRDDHAQTAEMFAFLGKYPQRRVRDRKHKRDDPDQELPNIRYGIGGKRRGR